MVSKEQLQNAVAKVGARFRMEATNVLRNAKFRYRVPMRNEEPK